jgi:hypothetical protein
MEKAELELQPVTPSSWLPYSGHLQPSKMSPLACTRNLSPWPYLTTFHVFVTSSASGGQETLPCQPPPRCTMSRRLQVPSLTNPFSRTNKTADTATSYDPLRPLPRRHVGLSVSPAPPSLPLSGPLPSPCAPWPNIRGVGLAYLLGRVLFALEEKTSPASASITNPPPLPPQGEN